MDFLLANLSVLVPHRVNNNNNNNNNIDFYLGHTHEIHINALYNTNKHNIKKKKKKRKMYYYSFS